MREYSLKEMTAVVSLSLLHHKGIGFSNDDFVSAFDKTEEHVLELGDRFIEWDFKELRRDMDESQIDEWLSNLSAAIAPHRLIQRIQSLKGALANAKLANTERGLLHRWFGS